SVRPVSASVAMQSRLPPGWLAVSRDGSMLVGPIAVWLRPEPRGVQLQDDVERLAAEATAATNEVRLATEARDEATAAEAAARRALAQARDAEAAAAAARARAEELDR